MKEGELLSMKGIEKREQEISKRKAEQEEARRLEDIAIKKRADDKKIKDANALIAAKMEKENDLLDQFAGAALSSLPRGEGDPMKKAMSAYTIAAAMMGEREKINVIRKYVSELVNKKQKA